MVDYGPGDDLHLTWGGSCMGERDYEVYEGFVGNWYSHSYILCTTNGQTEAIFTPAGGFTYYLVVPHNEYREGSYGTDSDASQRPPGVRACRAQAFVVCGPT